ncbi:aspartyl-tRNA(Asn)/glutamyl-tRNA(Gln) amidotransferase subunit C [Methanohalophilus levihalophilus]|uniref:Asp-tRNA(Asn)/Glu-tRNA(Gln) amidotransferase subunit GatC n=1 Tax=Methanohalophilus levihalophilus TaxID=1431282 RepID=UPI001AE82830|nr:Asp-tRNA(Asn)/Glu-tRNA(Gln) amidotransferase subunit GatC [Methanohalophilus levihalophilus]MBP2029848.1 aspartyl-tRNA(Asn)/glutamyl-tRNA(Gln) amidotransferase subunit C [Methanohalophilus levihalophilus]
MITKDEVEHVGWLSRISLSEEEAEKYASELNTVLDYFNQLDEVDTSGVDPTYHVADLMNVFREDERTPSLPQEDVLSNADESKEGYIKGPKIM